MNSGNAMFGAISEKFRTFDIEINFAIPQFLIFDGNFYCIINQFIRKVKNFFGISRQSPAYKHI